MTDHVGDFLKRRNAAVAALPSPLFSAEQNAARAAAGPPPEPIGDAVADYQARERWRQRCNPDPYGLRRP